MLCDIMLGEWTDPKKLPSLDDGAKQITAMKEGGASVEELRAAVERYGDHRWKQLLKEIHDYDKESNNKINLLSESIEFDQINNFKNKVKEAHKFFLTTEFASASLSKMATPETIVKAKEWFRLIHDPMWLEWQIEGLDRLRMGAVFFSKPVEGGDPAIMCYVVSGLHAASRTGYSVNLCRLFPDSIRTTEKGYELDVEDDQGRMLDDEESCGGISVMAYDFIIRLNSPRITEFRACDDLTRINKKRRNLGRLPLCTYQVVDLNREIKASLRLAGQDSDSMRFHWRRGHFKARKSGLFWWNPHTAGRKVNGEIRKAYAA